MVRINCKELYYNSPLKVFPNFLMKTANLLKNVCINIFFMVHIHFGLSCAYKQSVKIFAIVIKKFSLKKIYYEIESLGFEK